MDYLRQFQQALEKMYPSLTVFSDLDWEAITGEYLASHDERPQDLEEFIFNFPQYLQMKANEGDCPPYLHELAFYELIQDQIIQIELEAPDEKGLYLNPTLSFLNLQFDVEVMMDEATKGTVQIIERPHILCLYRHPEKGLHHIEIDTEKLEVLQLLENSPAVTRNVIPEHFQETLRGLINLGMIIEA